MPTREPFYAERPVFVKIAFKAAGRDWQVGEEFPWSTRGIKESKVAMLYKQNFLKHDKTAVVEQKIGDGLDEMLFEELMNLTNKINEKVEAHTTNKSNYNKAKVKKVTGSSEISRQNQIRNIRRFRQSGAAWMEFK